LALSADGQILALKTRKSKDADEEGVISFWQVNNGQPSGPVLDLGYNVVAFSSNGKLLASKKNGDDLIEIWDFDHLKVLYALKLPGKGKANSREELIFSETGQTLFAWYSDNNVIKCVRWDLNSRQSVNLPLEKDPSGPYVMAISGDGKIMAINNGGRVDPIILYSLPEWKEIGRIPVREFCYYFHFAFSPDEKFLALSEFEHHGTNPDPPVKTKDFVILYDVQQRNEAGRFLTTGDVGKLAFSKDGKILAAIRTSKASSGVFMWDVPALRPLKSHFDHKKIENFEFCPDGQHLASVGEKGNIILWKLVR
jgi:WD40 repeat protein